MTSFTFAYPWVLWLGLLLPLFAFLKSADGPGATVQFSSVAWLRPFAHKNRSRAGSLFVWLRLLSLAGLIIALARPQTGKVTGERSDSGIDMMLAIDLSPSMRALDYHTKDGQDVSRVQVVRETVGHFIEDRPNDRIGMVAFAGQTYLISPLTLDHTWLLHNVQRLEVGLAGDATAIGSAIAACANRLRDQKSKSKVIVLLTDGANNTGKITPVAAAEAAHALGIRIYTIGCGSNDKAKFPIQDSFGQTEYIYIPVDIDEDALRQIAQIGDGKFFRAADTDSLKRVYREINRLEKTRVASKQLEEDTEYFYYPAFFSLFCSLLESALINTRWRRIP